MILTNVYAIGSFLSGDSAIAPHASAHVATAGVASIPGHGAHAGAGAGIPREQPKPKGGKGDGNNGGGGGKGGGAAKEVRQGPLHTSRTRKTSCYVRATMMAVALLTPDTPPYARRTRICVIDATFAWGCIRPANVP